MPSSTDSMLSHYAAEIDQRQNFIDKLIGDAQSEGRDLSDQDMELITRARDHIVSANNKLGPLMEARSVAQASTSRLADLALAMRGGDRPPVAIEYRSAGEYLIEQWRAGLGDREAAGRLDLYERAASHQTTSDNPGLIPTPIIGPVISFIDTNRPVVTRLGPKNMPSQNWTLAQGDPAHHSGRAADR